MNGKPLPAVRHFLPDLELGRHARGPCTLHAAPAVVEQDFRAARLEEERRQAGEVAVHRGYPGMDEHFRIASPAYMARISMPRLWLSTGSRTALATRVPSCGSVRSVSGDISDRAGRHRQSAVARREQHRERHAAARGDAAHHDASGVHAELEQLLVGPDTVVVAGRKRILRREPVEDETRAGVGRRAEPRHHGPLHVRQPCDIRAARKVQDHAVRRRALLAQPLGVAVRKGMIVRHHESRRVLREQPLDGPDLLAQPVHGDVALQLLLDREAGEQARRRRLPADHVSYCRAACSAIALAAL